ncbi:MAG: DUF3857 domain-containing protein [Taibaiella sp.]|nr:DUF3857 domain-containing protein [Taibaiella sp.]
MKKSIFTFSLLAASITMMAQQNDIPKFPEWDPKPKMHVVPPEYYKEHAVILLENEKRDYKYEGTGLTLYTTKHRIIKVLDRKGIEDFNQIDIPFERNRSRVDSVKARTILPDGTVRDLKYEMLYIGGGGLFFALDGVEKNAEIEVMIKYKAVSSFFGSVQFQHSLPVLNTYFELNYPKELTFNTKGYHGFPSGSEQAAGGHKQVKIYKANIPALEKQPFSYYDVYCMRLDYALDHYTTRGGYNNSEPYTWDKLAQTLYQENYRFTESDKKAVNKFLTSIGIRGIETDRQKIKMIENGIKTEIVQYWELSGKKDAENIDSVISKKSASATGIIKLFCACFRMAGVQHELGVVSDRREHLLDTKFINWAPLTNYVFYFPGEGGYLAPDEPFFRYPEIPSTMLNNKGVFCKTNPEAAFNIGKDLTEGEAIIRSITPLETGNTRNSLEVAIKLDKDMDPALDLTYSYTGYAAGEYRKTLAVTPKQKRKEMVEEMIGVLDNPEDLKSFTIVNEGLSNVYAQKPLILNATVKAPHLIEKAGNRYLVRIGEAIGKQPNLYGKEERILPIDVNYPHSQVHTITMDVPNGYKIKNLQALNMHEEHDEKDNATTTAYFDAGYKLNGNRLTVTLRESYTQLHYAITEYEEFRRVVNAAADFNKVTLVLEPTAKAKPAKKAKANKATANKATPAKRA